MTWPFDTLAGIVEKSIGLAVAFLDPRSEFMQGAQIMGCEVIVKGCGAGHAPPPCPTDHVVDLVLHRGDSLEVWDWKLRMRLEDQYIPDITRSVTHSWQLHDYAYFVQQYYNRSVSKAGQIILAPTAGRKGRILTPYIEITQEVLEAWYADAQKVWAQMASSVTWRNFQACTDKHQHYGQLCPYLEGCHVYQGRETLFPGLYARIV